MVVRHLNLGEFRRRAAGVLVAPTTVAKEVGTTAQVTATVLPEDATNKDVTWSSSDEKVATVSAAGLVACKAIGSATITARTADGGHTASCSIMVLASSGSMEYDSVGAFSWTCPEGVSRITVTAVGGGGGGGGSYVGASASGSGKNGADGGDTKFGGSLLIAAGGKGGGAGTYYNGGPGGAAGGSNSSAGVAGGFSASSGNATGGGPGGNAFVVYSSGRGSGGRGATVKGAGSGYRVAAGGGGGGGDYIKDRVIAVTPGQTYAVVIGGGGGWGSTVGGVGSGEHGAEGVRGYMKITW